MELYLNRRIPDKEERKIGSLQQK